MRLRLLQHLEKLQARAFSKTRPLCSGRGSSIGSVMARSVIAPIDHLTPAEQAAVMMSEAHVDALPITKNDKIVGIFTEHDYFEKVLNESHSATHLSPVLDVATTGPKLVVAAPDDSVEKCVEAMIREDVMALPVVEKSGRILGAVSMAQLSRIMLQEACREAEMATTMRQSSSKFSEPSIFPEDPLATMDSTATSDDAKELFDQLKRDLHATSVPSPQEMTERMTDQFYEERAAGAFSEASVFPDVSPAEDQLFSAQPISSQTHPLMEGVLLNDTNDAMLPAPHDGEFSTPSDFPETVVGEELLKPKAKQPE